MSTTLTATPQPLIGSVKLVAETTAPATVTAIYRLDALGQTPIRTIAGLLPASRAVLEDYEAPFGEQITYTILTSNNQSASAAVTLATSDTVLGIPQTPARRVVIPIITGLAAARDQPGGADQIIGRPEPLITILPLGARTGQITMIAPTYAQARQIEALYATGYTLLLRQPAHVGISLYHLATNVATRAITVAGKPAYWEINVSYAEQARPAGALVGTLGWDYSGLASSRPDYYAVQNRYPDLAAIAEGA